MTLTLKKLTAVEQFVARFTFDYSETTTAMQQDLAQQIETALSQFKAADLQPLIERTVRRELQKTIVAAIETWVRSYYDAPPIGSET